MSRQKIPIPLYDWSIKNFRNASFIQYWKQISNSHYMQADWRHSFQIEECVFENIGKFRSFAILNVSEKHGEKLK